MLGQWVKEICRKYQISPWRWRGQNFLINKRILEKILEVAEIERNDIILEIGAGFGILTKGLAKKAKKVMAVEIDKRLVEILRKELTDFKNVEIIQGDILDEMVIGYLGKRLIGYKIVANLPYNITGAVLRKFLTQKPKPKLMVLMLQKEVAERICARPGKMSLLSVMVQFYGQPKIVEVVSQNNFWPKPKVSSAILKISRIDTNPRSIDTNLFFKIIKKGFSSPRKYLINNLESGNLIGKEGAKKIFKKIGLSKKIRAQELSVGDWQQLYKFIKIIPTFTLKTNKDCQGHDFN